MKDNDKTKNQLLNELSLLRQRNAELEKIEEQFEILQSSIKYSNDAIFLINKEAKFLDVNEAGCRHLGYSKKELLSMIVPDIDPGFPKEKWSEHWEELRNKGSLTFETIHKHKSGRKFPAEVKLNYFQLGDKEFNFAFASDITEKKKTEKALYASEEQYRNLVEMSQDLIFKCDKDGCFIYLNSAWETVLGYKRDEMLGHHFSEFKPPEKTEKDSKIFQNIIKGQDTYGYETTYIAKSRKPVCLVVNARFLKDRDGNIIGTQGTAHNITERKQAEDIISKSENELSSLYNAITDFMTVINTDYRIAKVNRIVEKQYGNDLAGKVCYEVYQGRKEICPKCPTRKAIETKKPAFSFQPATEVSPPVDIYAFPIFNMGGDVIAVVEHGKDVTERMQVEDTIKESEKKLKIAQEVAKIGSWDWDIKNNILTWSDQTYRNYGYEPGEVDPTYELFESHLYPDDREPVRKAVEHCLKTGKPYEIEIRTISKNGDEGTFLAMGSVVKDDMGETNRFFGTMLDITERKQLEEELQKMQKLDSIGTLAGGIAHDFNNLLSALRNNVYLSKMNTDEEHISYKNLESSEKIIDRATNLTQQLLTFSKGGSPVKKTASIIEIINESAEFALKGSNIKCECSMSENTSPVEVDPGQMNQVLHNLVLNAVQAMPEGGTIRIWTENVDIGSDAVLPLQEGKYVKIVFQDQGIGIAEAHLKKIFDPYFTTKEAGSGLGLSVVYSIIRNHDGQTLAESEIGTGTTFTIYLPASEKKIEDKETVEDTFAAGEGKILLMDDEKIIRETAEQLLSQKGYKVECAKDGEEAIELYQRAMEASQPFNAVILDLTIRGGMGGKEAVKKLQEIDPNVRAIVVSGYSNDPVLANYKEYGFCGVFAKHDKTEELGKTLHNVINGYQ
jgi:PAS domain S-box-containing protein